jgi:hypothetical protein
MYTDIVVAKAVGSIIFIHRVILMKIRICGG